MAKKKEITPKKKVKRTKQKPKVVETTPPEPINAPPKYPTVTVGTGFTSDMAVKKTFIDSKDMRKKTGKAGVIHPKRVKVVHPKEHKFHK